MKKLIKLSFMLFALLFIITQVNAANLWQSSTVYNYTFGSFSGWAGGSDYINMGDKDNSTDASTVSNGQSAFTTYATIDMGANVTVNKVEMIGYTESGPGGSHYKWWVNCTAPTQYFVGEFEMKDKTESSFSNPTNVTNEVSIECSNFFVTNANAGTGQGQIYELSFYYHIFNITAINFTSEGGQICDETTPCGPTGDTTPTFRIYSDSAVACRISDQYQNYSDMGTARDCSSGQYSQDVTCTLNEDDSLITDGTDYAYIACRDSTNYELIRNLTMIIGAGGDSIAAAINSAIDTTIPGAIIKTNQKVYLRYINGTQKSGTFDKVAIYGSKRWLINYLQGSDVATGVYSIGTTINVWENSTVMTTSEITSAIQGFIDATK